MREIEPILLSGRDGSRFELVKDNSDNYLYMTSSGEIIPYPFPRSLHFCKCLNPSYLVMTYFCCSRGKGVFPYSYNFYCSNPLCPYYRLHVDHDGLFCSFHANKGKTHRLVLLDLRKDFPFLVCRKRYNHNFLHLDYPFSYFKDANRMFRPLFFQRVIADGYKIEGQRLVKKSPDEIFTVSDLEKVLETD